jgi:hypothetical protein
VFGATTEKFERAICYGAAATSSFDAVDLSSYNSTISFKTTAGVVVAEPTAAAAGADTSAVAQADWTLTEDRAGKHGYIAEGVSHAVLTARMQCSAKRSGDAAGSLYILVAVTYMQSNEGVGVVLMYGPQKHQPHVRGRHTQAAAAVISSHTKAASSKDICALSAYVFSMSLACAELNLLRKQQEEVGSSSCGHFCLSEKQFVCALS